MPARARLVLLLATACFPLAAPAGAQAAKGQAVLTQCAKPGAGGPGSATFEARMSAVPGTRRMQARFTLEGRTPAAPRWAPVAAPGFGRWQTSMAGVARYVYAKRVEALLAPASYRVQVRFRWLDARGHPLAAAAARSAACVQPDPRPELVVRAIRVAPAALPARRRYIAVVANRGRTAAGPFAVAFSLGATVLGRGHAAGLAPGATVRVAVTGPACQPGEPIEAQADPDGAVDQRSGAGDALTVACPAS